ncbi:hypothetical protein PC9H_008972 [Pleurotus ostreatus]|uniref:Uncharacterized protein n=1 Tax=Pleurotus ostreatus TaxID=5322 RepID=A0A8H7DS50_PLEOS|nr:uncharacterized protein PC9H_008972 [Pleurotus ostreatus]KAF7426603.1 hypothetical protein PC9H_008972 [Pleurotus ostreatus]
MHCSYCGETNPRWKSGRSLSRHQAACSRKYLRANLPPLPPELEAPEPAPMLQDFDMLEPAPVMDLGVPEVEIEPPEAPSGRTFRRKRMTWKKREAMLDLPPRIQPAPPGEREPAINNTVPPSQAIRTPPNAMGMYRIYPQRPTHNSDESVSLDDLADANCNTDITDTAERTGQETDFDDMGNRGGQTPWSPFLSSTIARLLCWFHSGSTQKSVAELDSLVKNVLLKDDFDTASLKGFSTSKEHMRVDNALKVNNKVSQLFPGTSGWEQRSVVISLPAPKVKKSEAQAPTFEIKDINIRPLLSVMQDAFQGPEFASLHLTPFEECWNPLANHNKQQPDLDLLTREPFSTLPRGHERTYSEIYTSQAMMDAHRNLPVHPTLETVVVAYMFWSDATHLATFGTASLWPLYTFFGNCSKYLRLKPTSNHCHHQAYIPSLPDSLNDQYRELYGHAPRPAYLTHLKRELMQAVWRLLLTAEFVHAFVHGLAIRCFDGIVRLLFPRFFTYSADYPEKVLLATIRYLGGCPCPRCLIAKAKIRNLGMKHDMLARERLNRIRIDSNSIQNRIETARKHLFAFGALVNGTKVDGQLKKDSLVPTRNAFSILQPHGLNFYALFVPDLLHEFELGVWKAVFIHLIRILHVLGPDSVAALNERYRKVPTFGRDVVRRFHADAAAMKKLAARDYEDLLQCAIPVFEGLLPEPHNQIVLDLLFALAMWHALAKLRLHTDSTLGLLQASTGDIGALLRKFSEMVCPSYSTKDLPREAEARVRKARKADSTGTSTTEASVVTTKLRSFNMNTYKMHALGDYATTIRRLGTSESWSTQVGELEHRRVKRLYGRTNKNKYEEQIAKQEQRQRTLREVRRRLKDADNANVNPPAEIPLKKKSLKQSLNDHYYISSSGQTSVTISEYLTAHQNDTAFTDFIPKLKAHLLGRLLNDTGDDEQYSMDDLLKVVIANDRLYLRKVLHVNYTSYDGRRCRDSLNPGKNSDFITASNEDDGAADQHPLWYGRLVQIFHATVHHPRLREPQEVDFLWVRWFGRDLSFRAGFSKRRLYRIGFVALDDDAAFTFVNPVDIIRAVHILPAFHYGLTQVDEISPVADATETKNQGKWQFFYVGMFSDRDTVMRYIGGAVGHQSAQTAQDDSVEILSDDSDSELDVEVNDEVLEEDLEDNKDEDVELSEAEDEDDLDQWLSEEEEEDSLEDAASEQSEDLQVEIW